MAKYLDGAGVTILWNNIGAKFLSKSGGTMTGAINVSTSGTGNDTTKGLNFTYGNGTHHIGASESVMGIYSSGQIALRPAGSSTNGLVVSESDVTFNGTSIKNTDAKVLQADTTTANWRKIVLGKQNDSTAGTAVTSATDQVYVSKVLEFQPSTGTLAVVGLKRKNSSGTILTGSNTEVWNTNGGVTTVLTSHQTLTNHAKLADTSTAGQALVSKSGGYEWKTLGSNAFDSTSYVKIDPGAAEQTIKSSIGSLGQGVITLWRNINSGYSFLGFSNGATEAYLGGIGFPSANKLQFKNTSGTYYDILHAGNYQDYVKTYIYAGASGTNSNATATDPYIKIVDNTTYRGQIRLKGAGSTTVASDGSGNITITSTSPTVNNGTFQIAANGGTAVNTLFTANGSTATALNFVNGSYITPSVVTASGSTAATVTMDHNNSGVTAGTYGPEADVTGNNNATISVPEITVDAKGHLTTVTNRTFTAKNTSYSAGTVALLEAGSNTSNRVWPASVIATYVSDRLGSLAGALVYKGTIGTGGNPGTLPASHAVGDTYVVSTAGTYAGKACEVGDMIICKTAGSAASDSDWTVVNGENQVEDKGASLPAAGNSVTLATVDGTDITVTVPDTWTGVAKTGTVTSISPGTGLTLASGSSITSSGTIKAKLKEENANSGASTRSTSSNGGLYAVEVDSSGYLAVRVPWVNSTSYVPTSDLKVTQNTNLGTLNSITPNALGYVSGLTKSAWNYNQTDGALIQQKYSDAWKWQIYGDYRTGHASVRGLNNSTWGSWYSIFDMGNVSGAGSVSISQNSTTGMITITGGDPAVITSADIDTVCV